MRVRESRVRPRITRSTPVLGNPGAVGIRAMRPIVTGVAILILAGIGINAWILKTQAFDPPPRLPPHLRWTHSPALAIELVRSADEVRSILRDPTGDHNRAVQRQVIREDWYTIATYWLSFLGMGAILAGWRWPGARWLAVVVALAATAAALCDVLENRRILRVLNTEPDQLNDAMARAIRGASLAKWGLFAVVDGLLSPLFLAYRGGPILARILSTLAGWALATAALLGFVGLVWNPALLWSLAVGGLGLVAALAIFLFFPGTFLLGVGAAGVAVPPTGGREMRP